MGAAAEQSKQHPSILHIPGTMKEESTPDRANFCLSHGFSGGFDGVNGRYTFWLKGPRCRCQSTHPAPCYWAPGYLKAAQGRWGVCSWTQRHSKQREYRHVQMNPWDLHRKNHGARHFFCTLIDFILEANNLSDGFQSHCACVFDFFNSVHVYLLRPWSEDIRQCQLTNELKYTLLNLFSHCLW